MSERLEARARQMTARRIGEILDDLMAADLPPGLSAERVDGGVAIQGRGLLRRLAYDARLRAIGPTARDG